MVATFPGRTQALGLITEPLLGDLHLDRVTYAQFNLWASLLGALFCFPAGWALNSQRTSSQHVCLQNRPESSAFRGFPPPETNLGIRGR